MLKSLSMAALLAVVACSDDGTEPRAAAEYSSYYLQILDNATATIDAGKLDSDDQNPPTYSNTPAMHGTVTMAGAVFTYTPEAQYNGKDGFDIVRTQAGVTTSIPVSITITHADLAPVAQDLAVELYQGVSTSIELLALDSDSAILTYAVVTPPAHGTLIGTPPSVVYAPDKDFVGTDQLTFEANDGELDSQPGVVTLTIDAQ